MFDRILLVCTGNICRSPLAEALLKKKLPGRTVLSAGTSALVGEPADALAVETGKAHGLDLSDHRAQQATRLNLFHSDLILALDGGHYEWILSHCPELRGRVFKLGRWNGDKDVADPFRHPREAFEEAFERIEEFTESWMSRLGR